MYRIAIPTHRRHETIKEQTLSLLSGYENIDIFISDEHDYNLYRQTLPTNNLILTNTNSVCEKFNYIQNYYPEGEFIFVMEDDIKQIKTLYDYDTKKLLDFIYNFCTKNDIKCAGVYPSSNEFYMSKTIDIGLTYIVANLYAFTALNDDRLNCILKTKNDYERSVKYYQVYGKIARFNFAACKTNNYTNKGGMQTENNRDADELEASTQLIQMYPSIFDINSRRKSKYTELTMKKMYNKIKL